MEILIQICLIMVLTLGIVFKDIDRAMKQLDIKKLIQYRDVALIGLYGLGMGFFLIAMQGIIPLLIAFIIYFAVGFIIAMNRKEI